VEIKMKDKEILVEVEIRTVDEYGNESHMINKFTEDGIDNGLNAILLFEQLKCFMKMAGYGDETINQIQWIDNE